MSPREEKEVEKRSYKILLRQAEMRVTQSRYRDTKNTLHKTKISLIGDAIFL